jgi:hypothetical protein
MDNFDQFFGRLSARIFSWRAEIDKMFANVVFDNFSDEPFKCAATGGRLLQDANAFLFALDSPLDGFDLTLDAAKAI